MPTFAQGRGAREDYDRLHGATPILRNASLFDHYFVLSKFKVALAVVLHTRCGVLLSRILDALTNSANSVSAVAATEHLASHVGPVEQG